MLDSSVSLDGSFVVRPRRLRRGQVMRDAVADVRLHAEDLILPLFVSSAKEPIAVKSMPGIEQLPVSAALEAIATYCQLGLKQFMLFGVTDDQHKDAVGSYAWSDNSPVNQLLKQVHQGKLDVLMYADLCFCEYTSHGHCGVLCEPMDASVVDNDLTLVNLGKAAVAQAKAGAQVVCPSGMIDGQVRGIRQALDQAGFTQVAILAYSVKYASSFYGPFRDAGCGGMSFGDRKGYQMDCRQSRGWRTELNEDIKQGADMVMVKPAMGYLDVIHQVRQACDLPVAGYHVSGEYAMLHAAAGAGVVDLQEAVLESTMAIKRSGADLIITYFAPMLLKLI